ncbi:hypothetical protein [Microbacterium invictum]|uniref:Uncharacterized protein n=1 Tax=Microbacterium invictum TaxID=515415 RepID=A0AA40SRJ1_9MICO|nr:MULTISPECIES: hypothetical protein [Microbacterium]MBB4141088.1 hypothetical protein [Microbacterium invictum]
MTVSPDVIGVIIAGAMLAATLFGGLWALMSHLMNRLEARLGVRFDNVETRLGRVEGEITELKIAVARLEGPTPRLLTR